MSFKEEMQKLSFLNSPAGELIKIIKEEIQKEAAQGDTIAIVYLLDEDFSEYDIKEVVEYFKNEEQIDVKYKQEESWMEYNSHEHARWRVVADWWDL